VVLYGTIPMYRDLGLSAGNSPSPAGTATGASNAVGLLAGNSAKSSAPTSPSTHTSPTAVTGRDVRQLEENLRALGYRGFTVDSTFNQATAVAVKKWQKDLGLPQTGTVAQGDVVFASGPMRVAQALAKVGDEASGDMLSVTGLTRAVTAAASAQDTAWAGLGNTVTLTLPNGTTTPGKVIHVGTAATAPTGQDGAGNGAPATVPVTITITNQKDLGTLTSGPVSVTYVSQVAKDVLAVPVEALVALAEGGYGLEVVDPKGSHYVGVKTGMFTDALVEITSDQISEGTTVRVPQ
jgi:peptidoglycan hydrolase-like protein with peptidoglycan-binding domain